MPAPTTPTASGTASGAPSLGAPDAPRPVSPETPHAPDTTAWGARHAHDPTAVVDDEGTYWLFSTDASADGPVPGGVQVRRSTDLVTWEFHGWALAGVPGPAAAWSGAAGLWAPEVVRADDEWRMYYSASSFGSRRSAIGLATAPHPAGPWTDWGVVVASEHVPAPEGLEHPNAIDANVVTEADGSQWLVYGSFFAGIHALPLDPETGFVVDEPAPGTLHDAPGTLLARRPRSVDGAIEGAFVLPRPGGGWAMLVSYGSLFSTYHLRVAVADAVTGPYRDRTGHDLRDLDPPPDEVGTAVLAGHRFPGGPGVLAPGHASVLTEPDHQVLVHHVRDAQDPAQHRVEVRRLVWTHDGWPLVAPQPWAGPDREVDDTALWPTSVDVLDGTWELLHLADRPDAVQDARPGRLDVAPGSARALGHGRFTWTTTAGTPVSAVAFPSWDAVRARPAPSVVAIGSDGRVVAGTRTDASGPGTIET
ncbi:arabinan endo-1,5-alpha-L-arabinosidase [Cellulosimicrobium sp. PMB13]|uniref:arabinan endo-1,5-alpha-L-arabinosidase n=1 Tax=Cellulosimicrobium sp. PMB13 TaxID=3120158 RepID=UPI003F4BA23A